MGLRVRRRVKIAPGINLNFSNSGMSMSTKLAKGVTYRSQVIGGKTVVKKKPITVRWWFIALALLFLIICGASTEPDSLFWLALVGLLMLAATIVTIIVRVIGRIKDRVNNERADM